jgi:hypothetical protein
LKGESDIEIEGIASGNHTIKFVKDNLKLENKYNVPVNDRLKLKAHFRKMEVINVSQLEAAEATKSEQGGINAKEAEEVQEIASAEQLKEQEQREEEAKQKEILENAGLLTIKLDINGLPPRPEKVEYAEFETFVRFREKVYGKYILIKNSVFKRRDGKEQFRLLATTSDENSDPDRSGWNWYGGANGGSIGSGSSASVEYVLPEGEKSLQLYSRALNKKYGIFFGSRDADFWPATKNYEYKFDVVANKRAIVAIDIDGTSGGFIINTDHVELDSADIQKILSHHNAKLVTAHDY